MTYDKRCEDLARFFLEDSGMAWDPAHLSTLSEGIQRTIEDFIATLPPKGA